MGVPTCVRWVLSCLLARAHFLVSELHSHSIHVLKTEEEWCVRGEDMKGNSANWGIDIGSPQGDFWIPVSKFDLMFPSPGGVESDLAVQLA
jgi:hypothetical protein